MRSASRGARGPGGDAQRLAAPVARPRPATGRRRPRRASGPRTTSGRNTQGWPARDAGGAARAHHGRSSEIASIVRARIIALELSAMAVAPVSTVARPPRDGPLRRAARRADAAARARARALLLASPPEHLRNGDTHFKFRQDSDILYLTGFEEPGAVVRAAPGPRDDAVRAVRAPARSRRGDLDRAARRRRGRGARLRRRRGVPVDELDDKLAEIVGGRRGDPLSRSGASRRWTRAVARLLGRLRVGRAARPPRAGAPRATRALTLHEMRLIKSPDEVAIQRRAAEITAEAHIAAMRAARAAAQRARDRGADRLHLPHARRHRPRLPDDRRRRRQRDHPPLRREPRAAACAGSSC